MLNRWQRTIVDLRGNVVPYAQLQIRVESTQAAATIYADKDGREPIPNGIVTADANGYEYFYAKADLYRISSMQPTIDWRYVDIGAAGALQKDSFPPIGFCYTQYPDTPTPSELFGGTWTLMFNTEGVFFRTEGQGASAFGSGVQGDAQQPITGSMTVRRIGDAGHNTINGATGPFYLAGTSADAYTASGEVTNKTQVVNFDSSLVVRTASENRPRNRTVRIWRKTAH